MSAFPFGGHPQLGAYIDWLRTNHNGTAQSGYAVDQSGAPHSLTKLRLPNGKSVVVVGVGQMEYLVPSMVGYLDRRLGVKSPWFSV
jgi:hypothetical protein